VLIVDDHPTVREGLAARISRQGDLQVCGEADGVDAAIEMIDRYDPDVAVIDISLKQGNGLDLIKRVKTEGRRTRMLAWSMFDESLYADRAIRAGALGYITKEQATDQIINAIRRVQSGQTYMAGDAAATVAKPNAPEAKAGTSVCDDFSDRELQVFRYIGEGLNMAQIAEKMQLSVKTIETYRSRIKRKLNHASRTELVRMAVEWVLTNR
jgi:DNA-binding NarL/FixJ family response regulator